LQELHAEREELLRSQARLARGRKQLQQRRERLAPAAARYADREYQQVKLDEQQLRVCELEQAVIACEARCAAVGYDPEEAHRRRGHLDEMEETRRTADQARGDAEREYAQAQADADAARARANDADQQCAAVERAIETALREQQLGELYEQFRRAYQQRNLTAVARRASDLLERAVPDGAIRELRFTTENEIEYLDVDGRRHAVGRLSGGEATVAGLCLRLAVAEQAQAIVAGGRLRILVLDEVLAALDDERLEAVGRVFEELQSRHVFDHIVLVTHLEAVRSNWPGAGLQVKKVDSTTSELELRQDSA
jgi:hypothetical protein